MAAASTAVTPAPDLSGLYQRIDAVELAVRDLANTLKAAQAASTLVATEDQIDAATQQVAASTATAQPSTAGE